MRRGVGRFPRLRVGLVSQGYDQGLVNCQSLSQNHVGLGDPDLHSGFRDRLFGHLAEDLTLSWSDSRFIAWQRQNRRIELGPSGGT
jgi:hypothetical protein